MGGLGEASFRLRLIFAVDTLHAVVVVFWVFLWGGFWHRFIVLSRRVDFRSQVLSSGFSWLFRLHLETQAFELRQVVILYVVFRLGEKQPLKRIEKLRFWLSFLSHLEAVFVHVDVNFWLRRGFAFDALLGALVFLLGSLVGEKTALISCIVSLRLFSSANALHGVLVTFRGPFWDLFNRFAHSARPGTETQHSELDAASSTQRVGCSEFCVGVTSDRWRDQRPWA